MPIVNVLKEKPLKNAYIGEVWTPWSNTIMYLPLEKDWNDYSGNNHNLTWNWTPTYTTSWGTKNVLNLNGSTLWKIANLSGTYTDYTFNVWCKPTNITTTWQEIFDNTKSINDVPNDSVYFNFNWTSQGWWKIDFAFQYRPNGWTNTYQNVYGTANRTANTWYNVVITSTSSWIKIYVNWTQIASNSTTWAIVLDSGYNFIWGRYTNYTQVYNNRFIGYMSEFIFEDKTWTAQEISHYFDLTKSNYWL